MNKTERLPKAGFVLTHPKTWFSEANPVNMYIYLRNE